MKKAQSNRVELQSQFRIGSKGLNIGDNILGKVLSIFLFVFISFTHNLQAQCLADLTGDFSVCPGETVSYSITNYQPTHAYNFNLNGGGQITSNNNGIVVIQWNSTPGGPYALTMTETGNSCTNSTQKQVVIEGDVTLVCNDNLNISLAGQCEVTITADVILEAPQFPEESYAITVTDQYGNVLPNTLDATYLNQQLSVSIQHICSGNSCWGYIVLEDKLAPVIACTDEVLTCAQFENYVPKEPQIVSDNCGNSTWSHTISDVTPDCGSPYSLIRSVTWTLTDDSGNASAPCTQNIYVEKVDLNALEFPKNYDGLPGNHDMISCDANIPLNTLGHPDPSYTGTPIGLSCSSIQYTYEDVKLPLCNQTCSYDYSSYKIIRTFIAVDWCTGVVREENQVIKVQDFTPPVLQPIANMTRAVNPFDCSAQIVLPTPQATDNCTSNDHITYTYSANVGQVTNGVLHLPAPAKTMDQPVTVTLVASDCCGNINKETFELTLVDNTPPVVVADAHDVIGLLPNGITTLKAKSMDDGSYDNCGPIGFFIKRMDDGGDNPSVDLFEPAGNDNAQFNEAVHFFCSDVDPDNPVMVQFRVCDDANMDGVIGNTGDNCNLTMVEVTVQDKYAPIVICPADLTISCTEYDGIDLNNQAQVDALFGKGSVQGSCDPELTETITPASNLSCGEGKVYRTFSSTTTGGSDQCTQTITVKAYPDNLLTCDRISFKGFTDQQKNIYNWCKVNDNNNDNDDDLPAIEVPGCASFEIAEIEINTENLCTSIGEQIKIDTFTYTGSTACTKYLVHYEIIDHCIFDENYVNPKTGQIDPFSSGNGYFEFYLEYNVVDKDPPKLTCKNETVTADLCEGYTGSFGITATDDCTPNDQLHYEYRIDAGANGTIDFPANGKYFKGNSTNAQAIGLQALPVGKHFIHWRVNDGCGNHNTCTQEINILIKDKAPTPYCLGGLSTAVMNTNGQVEIWAKDFDKESVDDCGSPLTFTMIPEVLAQSSSNPYKDSKPDWTFGCEDIPNGVSQIVDIRVYVADTTGAYDYCTVTLKVEDNEANFCTDNIQTTPISGQIKQSNGDVMKSTTVRLSAHQPEFPMLLETSDEGRYSHNVMMHDKYQVTPISANDYLNGISTLDIVLIQKHILGISPVSDVYQLIGADVNKDCKINGSDLIQIRKLILGKYENDAFPNNTSWRFVQADQKFANSTKPCNVQEEYELHNLTDGSQKDFVAIKVGDMNFSSSYNYTGSPAITRSANALNLIIDDQDYEAFDVVRIPVYAADIDQVYGLQFELNLDGFNINGVEPGAMKLTDDHIGLRHAAYGSVNISYHEAKAIQYDDQDVLFTVLATAKQSGNLSQVAEIRSNVLASEAYVGKELEIYAVDLELRDNPNTSTKDASFTVLQNEPNPFSESTNIRFVLPRSGVASLKVFDITGKLVYSKSQSFGRGEQAFELLQGDMGGTGKFFYQIEFEGQFKTKKLIVVN